MGRAPWWVRARLIQAEMGKDGDWLEGGLRGGRKEG